MDDDSKAVDPGSAGADDRRLARRLLAVEAALQTLRTETRTARLVVCDDRGQERIVGEVVEDEALVRLELPGSVMGNRSGLLLYADPTPHTGPALGVQLWVEGQVVAVFETWRDITGWRSELKTLHEEGSEGTGLLADPRASRGLKRRRDGRCGHSPPEGS